MGATGVAQVLRAPGRGLAISRSLARAMGGELTVVHSAVGAGATFELTLPRAPAPSRPTPALTVS